MCGSLRSIKWLHTCVQRASVVGCRLPADVALYLQAPRWAVRNSAMMLFATVVQMAIDNQVSQRRMLRDIQERPLSVTCSRSHH